MQLHFYFNTWIFKEIEFLFKKEFLTSPYVRRVYTGVDGKEVSEQQARILDDSLDEDRLEKLGSFVKLDYRIRNNRKKHFAQQKVPEFPAEAFDAFSDLFERIDSLLTLSA